MEVKGEQWKDSISQSSSSRSSSITSASSDGHFDIRHFPLPKPSLSASEAQKQREAYSSWSSVQHNHLADLPGYDPNRIPFSVFSSNSSKPSNSTAEWSIASNESLFSIHDGNFGGPTKEEEPVHKITGINLVKIQTETEDDSITEKQDSETDDEDDEIQEEEMIEHETEDEHKEEEEMIEHESEDEHKEEEEDMIKTEVLAETETEKQEEIVEVQEDRVKEHKQEDTISIVSHSPSISCLSETSNNSIGSFAFPLLQKEDGVTSTPSMEIKETISSKRRPEYLLPQSPMRQAQPQPQESETPTQFQHKQFESQTQSPLKATRKGWFSCIQCPSKCCLFK